MDNFQEEDYSKKLDLKLWGTLFKFMRNVKKEVILLTILNMLYSLLSTLIPLANKYAMDTFVTNRDLSTFAPYVAIVSFLIVIGAIFTYKCIQYSAIIEVNIVHDIREDGFKNLQNLSFSYYDTTPVGWILARMSSDAQRIGDVIAWGCLDLVYSFFMIVFIIFNMFMLNPQIAVVGMCMMPVVAVVSIFFPKTYTPKPAGSAQNKLKNNGFV